MLENQQNFTAVFCKSCLILYIVVLTSRRIAYGTRLFGFYTHLMIDRFKKVQNSSTRMLLNRVCEWSYSGILRVQQKWDQIP